jgi:BirA family transcriptional regulator, biotin operon repressor / biotin---[acetyl-CoA-carboxylase] ligase
VIPASSPLPPELAAGYNAALARMPPLRLDLRWFPSVGSTMDLAAQAARDGAPEGLVICADEQTAGRGRRGRSWSSPAGAGLYLSIVLRPAHDTVGDSRALMLITLAAGVGVREAILRGAGLDAELKWPNDVMIGRRKLAGILAEGHDIGSIEQAVVVGIGMNVLRSRYPADVELRATSIETELGGAVDRARLLEELLVSIATWYDRLRSGDTDGILQTWRDASPSARGARVESVDRQVSGVTADVDETGALLIRTASGTVRVVSGELTWL